MAVTLIGHKATLGVNHQVFYIFETGARLPNPAPVGILPPKMNNQYAHLHHHYIQLPYGREVNVRVPVIE